MIFYRGIQSAGASVVWAMDYHKVPFMHIFGSCWGLLAGSLLIALPTIMFKVRPTVPIEDDLKFSDESYEEVAPKNHHGTVNTTDHSTRYQEQYGHGYDDTKAV